MENKSVILPNYTIYVNNLNEKVKAVVVKKLLYDLFARFGRILEIICKKSGDKRGQAFIVFDSIESAKLAKQRKNGNAIAKLDGSFEEHIQKRKLNQKYKSLVTNQKGLKNRKVENPTNILIVKNLPDEVKENPTLIEVFKNREGCVDVKYVEGRNIAFITFKNEFFASCGKRALDGYKFYQKELQVNFTD